MLTNKVISADEAIALINEGDVVATTGFVQSCIPETLHAALEKRFVETGAPRNLTLIMCAGAGDSKGRGTGRLHHDGLLEARHRGELRTHAESRAGGPGEQDPRLQPARKA